MMPYRIEYTALANLESVDAFHWYDQPHINRGADYLSDVDRTDAFLKSNPLIYAKVSGDIRRAALKRFPFSLYFTIDGEVVTVLSCFHQSREPLVFIPA